VIRSAAPSTTSSSRPPPRSRAQNDGLSPFLRRPTDRTTESRRASAIRRWRFRSQTTCVTDGLTCTSHPLLDQLAEVDRRIAQPRRVGPGRATDQREGASNVARVVDADRRAKNAILQEEHAEGTIFERAPKHYLAGRRDAGHLDTGVV